MSCLSCRKWLNPLVCVYTILSSTSTQTPSVLPCTNQPINRIVCVIKNCEKRPRNSPEWIPSEQSDGGGGGGGAVGMKGGTEWWIQTCFGLFSRGSRGETCCASLVCWTLVCFLSQINLQTPINCCYLLWSSSAPSNMHTSTKTS